MYGINWTTFIEERTPSPVRQPVVLAWLHALIAPLKSLHTSFLVYKDTMEREVKITPQVRILRHWLNEIFDYSARRFDIVDYLNVEPILIWGEAYNSPVYLPVFMSSSSYDFIVYAPCETGDQIALIKGFLNKNKLAGKRYLLIFRADDGSICQGGQVPTGLDDEE